MSEIANGLLSFRGTEVYGIVYALGEWLGVYSGVLYFVLAVLAIYLLLRLTKTVVKIGLVAVVIYCCMGVVIEYLPYVENLLKIF